MVPNYGILEECLPLFGSVCSRNTNELKPIVCSLVKMAEVERVHVL